MVMKTINRPALFTLAAVLAATSFQFIVKARPTGLQESERRPVPVEGLTLKTQTSYLEWRSFTGRARAGRTSPLGFELGGTLETANVDIGSMVKKGDKLAGLDTARLKATLARLEGEKASAEANLTLAKKTFTRLSKTFDQGHASAQRRDEAEANFNQANAQLRALKASILSVQVDLEKSTILAPFDGVITERLADEGRILAAGTPLFTLVESGRLEAHIGVSSDIADHLTQKATYRMLDSQKRDFNGATIRAILPVIEGQTRTRMVIFTLPEGIARDGDLISILVKDRKQATGAWVPLRALSADVRGLWRLNKIIKTKDGQTRTQFENVQVLYTTGRQAFVSGTFSDGDMIVAGGVDRLATGERVSVVKTRENNLGLSSPSHHTTAAK